MNYIDKIKKRVDCPKIVSVLSQDMLWQKHGVTIWRAERFDGTPTFYPVYNYKNYYSYSLLALIVKKGFLNLNKQAYDIAQSDGFEILSNETLIDNDIKRIGGATRFGNEICDTDEYCLKLAEAIKKDISLIEELNPGFTNVILCGGKDSLNMLLAPWKNPVIVYSAQPNFPLVQDFVKDNNLPFEVKELKDHTSDENLQDEVAELCCRVDSRHWRWAMHTRQISEDHSNKIIIWKGQLGDRFFNPTWKTYIYPENQPKLFLCKLYKKLSPLMPLSLNKWIGKQVMKDVEQTHWNKGSITQGTHMGFMRALSDCLVVSAYHGKNVMEVFSKVSLPDTVQTDIRARIGAVLHGKDVIYPPTNPSPKIEEIRDGAHNPDLFVNLLKINGIK